jgi:LysM repeat protein
VTAEGVASASEASPRARPEQAPASAVDLKQVDRLLAEGQDIAAHRLLSTWYWEHPDQRERFQDRLNMLARRIYFQPQPHYIDPYEVQFGDRLETIARKYQVPWEYLGRMNRVEPQKIRAGQKLKVLQGPFGAVVDLDRFELTVHAHGYYVTRFPVGIGQENSTPAGTFRVTDKVVDPTYYGPDGVIAHDDPANPLGEHWIAINDEAGTLEGYGIHGTIEPESVGRAVSRGCIRLKDQDVADLYDLLTVGSEVIIRR